MGRKVEKVARWCETMSFAAMACEAHASPLGDARELPAYVPSENESKAFTYGLAVAFCMASEAAKGEFEPSDEAIDNIANAFNAWIEQRAEGGDAE